MAEPVVVARDDALTALFAAHYAGLLRLATALHDDAQAAEDAVQDAFARMYCRWDRLRDPDQALGYLRTCVANSARSRFRRLRVARRHAPEHVPHAASAEEVALDRGDHAGVLAALDTLPGRQRQVLVLRYYAQLSEADIAQTLGVSAGTVKQHAARGIAALGRALGEQ
jgi:RNA polymerase sigma-70 factor (sigma-E family)